MAYVGILPGDAGGVRGIFYLINYCGLSVHEKNLVLYLLLRFRDVRKSKDGVEGADIFLDYLSDQSKSMSVLYRTQIS